MSTREFTLKIGGIPYLVSRVPVGTVATGDSQPWGTFDSTNHTLRYEDHPIPERALRTFLHEVLHGIAFEYGIRELLGKGEEYPIDQLALGLSEVLGGLGAELPA
jgi:hypothetical protein